MQCISFGASWLMRQQTSSQRSKLVSVCDMSKREWMVLRFVKSSLILCKPRELMQRLLQQHLTALAIAVDWIWIVWLKKGLMEKQFVWLEQLHPKAKYFTHCCNHALVLSIVASCQYLGCEQPHGNVKEVHTFLKYSAKWKHILGERMQPSKMKISSLTLRPC